MKALISKSTLKRAHIWHTIPLKKSELQDGDLCMQRDNSVGIYNSKPDFEAFSLTRATFDGPTLIFYNLDKYNVFQHFPIQYYTDNLEDKDGERQYDVIKIIRGLFDPKSVNDPKKVEEFLKNESNYKNYFV